MRVQYITYIYIYMGSFIHMYNIRTYIVICIVHINSRCKLLIPLFAISSFIRTQSQSNASCAQNPNFRYRRTSRFYMASTFQFECFYCCKTIELFVPLLPNQPLIKVYGFLDIECYRSELENVSKRFEEIRQ